MHTLLLIEDDRLLCQVFREYLEGNEFIVFEANTGYRSLEIIKQHSVDIVLLDLGLPDGSGLDFIGRIKQYANSPMVVISGEKDPRIHIAAFEAGADDFVQKPFHLKEMKARIQSHIRRTQQPQLQRSELQDNEPRKICLGNWTIDPEKYQLFDQNNNANNLTAREFQILEALAANQGCVLRREDLCEVVREDNYLPTPRAIDIKIARIRKKIGDDANDPKIIKTVRGVGYLMQLDGNP